VQADGILGADGAPVQNKQKSEGNCIVRIDLRDSDQRSYQHLQEMLESDDTPEEWKEFIAGFGVRHVQELKRVRGVAGDAIGALQNAMQKIVTASENEGLDDDSLNTFFTHVQQVSLHLQQSVIMDTLVEEETAEAMEEAGRCEILERDVEVEDIEHQKSQIQVPS